MSSNHGLRQSRAEVGCVMCGVLTCGVLITLLEGLLITVERSVLPDICVP